MLRPLWESREHYEELKQLDDAMKEVKTVQRTQAGESGTGGQAGQRVDAKAKLSETRGPDAVLSNGRISSQGLWWAVLSPESADR